MYCKQCGTDMGNGKFCPNCGYTETVNTANIETAKPTRSKKSKVKRGCGTAILVFLILVVGVMVISVISYETSENRTYEEYNTVPKAPTLYIEYDIEELFDDLENNAMNAQKRFEGKHVKISGYIENIDASGKYFSIQETNDYTGSFYRITIYLNGDTQRTALSKYKVGDKIKVKGKITSVGEVLGYGMDLTEIME